VKQHILSHIAARNAPPGRYGDGAGLWLHKRERARGKWVLRYFLKGRRREMGLGPWPDVSIADARAAAAEARATLRAGQCPIEARRQQHRVIARLTVAQAIASCFEARKAQLKGDGAAGRWLSPLNVHVIPKIGDRAIEDVDQHALRDLLAPIWHTKPEAAAKALNRLSLTFTHAAALGLAVDLQACLKARALLGKQRHETEHIPALSYTDAPKFYQWLGTLDTTASRALRFLMLTLARTSEVRLATSDEIEGEVWSLSAKRTKTNESRRIPLVAEAQALVAGRSGHLFAAYRGKPLSDMAMTALMDRAGLSARPHGFRSTFRTWAEECTKADFETKEACLGHAVDVGVVGAYQRSDRLAKRRKLLEAWHKHLTRPLVAGGASGVARSARRRAAPASAGEGS
jgi:integrase